MKASRVSAVTLAFVLACLAWTWPGLRSKIQAQKTDTSVLLALDAESLDAVNGWSAVPQISCTHIVLGDAAPADQEAAARALGKNILWRISDDVAPAEFLPRVRRGDLVWPTDNSLEHPLLYLHLPERLAGNGGVCALEFDRTPALASWAARTSLAVVKTHTLGTREMLRAQPDVWRARLVRAVEERWVRCLIVHLSPALSLEDNVRFFGDTSAALRSKGFVLEDRPQRLAWNIAPLSDNARWQLALILSIVTPLLILYWARRLKGNAFAMFGVASLFSILTGVVIHALGATPAFVLGLEPLHGLKLQLCGALILSAPFLFSKKDVAAVLKRGIHSLEIAPWVALGVIVLALYWMRSGNHPLLPVTDAERRVRDALETFFVARPRFKEFLFGHPLFFVGLWLTHRPVLGRWWGDGRVFLWLGLVGQISILNTFTHFHAPFFYCALRTAHGLWLGLALAIVGTRLVKLIT
jgi:hypothetical protein